MTKLRIVLAALAITVFGSLWAWLTCGYLFTWIYTLPPVSVWRAPQEMTPLFWTVSTAGHFVLAIIFVMVLRWIAKGLPGTWLVKGLSFGLVTWLIGVLPGMFASGLFMAVNPAWPVYMSLNQLIALPLAGLIAASIAIPRPAVATPPVGE